MIENMLQELANLIGVKELDSGKLSILKTKLEGLDKEYLKEVFNEIALTHDRFPSLKKILFEYYKVKEKKIDMSKEKLANYCHLCKNKKYVNPREVPVINGEFITYIQTGNYCPDCNKPDKYDWEVRMLNEKLNHYKFYYEEEGLMLFNKFKEEHKAKIKIMEEKKMQLQVLINEGLRPKMWSEVIEYYNKI